MLILRVGIHELMLSGDKLMAAINQEVENATLMGMQ